MRQPRIVFGGTDMVNTVGQIPVDNAIRITPGKGNVTINARRNGEWVEPEVSDKGGGISADRAACLLGWTRRPRPWAPAANLYDAQEAQGYLANIGLIKILARQLMEMCQASSH